MKRDRMGALAGILGTADILCLWTGLVLPARYTPSFGFKVVFVLMSAGVLLTGLAALLHSKWWLLAVAGAIMTFVIFSVSMLS